MSSKFQRLDLTKIGLSFHLYYKHSLENKSSSYQNLHPIFKRYWFKEATSKRFGIGLFVSNVEQGVVFLYLLVSIVEIFLPLLPVSTKLHSKSQGKTEGHPFV